MSITLKLKKAESELPNEIEAVRRGGVLLKRAWRVSAALLGATLTSFREAQHARAEALRARTATSRRAQAAKAVRAEARAALQRAVESLASARVTAGAPPSDPLRGVFASNPAELGSLSPEDAVEWASRLTTSARNLGVDESRCSAIESAERSLSRALRTVEEEERNLELVESVLESLRPSWAKAVDELIAKAKAIDATSPAPVNKRRKGVFALLIVGDEEIDRKGLFGLLPLLCRRAWRWSRAKPLAASLVAGATVLAIGAVAVHEHHVHAAPPVRHGWLAR